MNLAPPMAPAPPLLSEERRVRLRPRWRRRAERHVTAHLELYLSALSLAIVIGLPLALELGTDVQELAGAALAPCVLQGLVHWVVRRRVKAVRQALIADVRNLLRDRINNHLQVVMFSLHGQRGSANTGNDRARLAQAMAAVAAVSRTLDELSTDSLRRWKHRYTAAVGDGVSDGARCGESGADSETGGSAAGR